MATFSHGLSIFADFLTWKDLGKTRGWLLVADV
jgi:hypothetical protein